jgi:haloacetate dehalogenase
LDHVFTTWAGDAEAIGEEARQAYRRALDPTTIAAICADYRASFYVDREHDAANREAGRRIAAPLLVVIGAEEAQLADAPEIWRAWADHVAVAELPGGHFLPEEAPEALVAALTEFLADEARDGTRWA